MKNYKTSFTTGGLFYREAINTAELYDALGNWESVKTKVLEDNLLHQRTRAASVRTARELVQRLQTLTTRQLEILREGARQEQNQILWLAVCKHYCFVQEFAVEVVHEKYLKMDLSLQLEDFDIFFNGKADWNEKLLKLTDTTQKKLRQVLFRMLREAEILSPNYDILPTMLSPRVTDAIRADDPTQLTIFPSHDVNYVR